MFNTCWVWVIGLGTLSRKAHIYFRNNECGKQESCISNPLKTEDQLNPFAVINVFLHCQYQKANRILRMLSQGLHRWATKAPGWDPL